MEGLKTMAEFDRRKSIDNLVEEFWRMGYMTVSRKFGTYLPEPLKIGNYDVDIIARYNKNYAIGIILNPQDLTTSDLYLKLKYLAGRQTKYSNKKVLLIVGVQEEYISTVKNIINSFEDSVRKNIKIFPIVEKSKISIRPANKKQNTLFS
ncbi:MAG: hypothetical protein HXY49_08030 [Ignavibacteriaceae bacterium]|nr:hypothetical protein [Ignavibacteriaceae bacterium]